MPSHSLRLPHLSVYLSLHLIIITEPFSCSHYFPSEVSKACFSPRINISLCLSNFSLLIRWRLELNLHVCSQRRPLICPAETSLCVRTEEEARASSLMFHKLITPPAPSPTRGNALLMLSLPRAPRKRPRTKDEWKGYRLLIIPVKGMESHPPGLSDTVCVCRTIHHLGQAAWSMRGSLWSSYLLTQLMEVRICIRLSAEGTGAGEQTSWAGLSPRCSNETIHHSFVCLYAPSHEQLMHCRRLSALLLFLYLTSPLFVSLSGPVTAALTSPADCDFKSIY